MIEILYVLNFIEAEFAGALRRLNCSIESIINEDIKIIIFNGSKKQITEQVPDTKLLLTHPKIKVYQKPVSGYFNKPVLINYAVKNFIEGEFFIFSDIDLVYQAGYIPGMVKYVNHDPAVIPFRVIPWNNNILIMYYVNDYEKLIVQNKDDKGGYAHGNGLMHKPSFLKIKGYNEHFNGYGPEDAEYNERIGKINSLIYNDKLKSCHLCHSLLNRKFYSHNSRLYHETQKKIQKIPDHRATEEQIQLLIMNGEKWGEIS